MQPETLSQRHPIRRLAIIVCVAVIALALPLGAPVRAAEAPKKFLLFSKPRVLPDTQFEDSSGRAIGLSQFRGRVILLNLWATWCEPCRREMPSLDRLQALLGGPAFEVVAVSLDYGNFAKAKAFYGEIGIRSLGLYFDTQNRFMKDLSVKALPTTSLVDAEGRERGWQTGAAAWDSPAMVAFLREQIARMQMQSSSVDE